MWAVRPPGGQPSHDTVGPRSSCGGGGGGGVCDRHASRADSPASAHVIPVGRVPTSKISPAALPVSAMSPIQEDERPGRAVTCSATIIVDSVIPPCTCPGPSHEG